MTPEGRDPWELETGLPNDVDAWMWNCRFGTKDEYKQAVMATVADTEVGGVAGLMFIADLYSDNGELLGSQGWSVGSGWIPSEDGKSMHHPTRLNVVDNTRYGQLQKRAIKELGVDMRQYGVPTQASCWDGMGFHWMMEEHATIKGQPPKRGLMPAQFVNRKTEKPKAAEAAPAAGPAAGAEAGAPPNAVMGQLKALAAASPDAKSFQKLALKMEAVTTNDELMATVLDSGPSGFYEQNKG